MAEKLWKSIGGRKFLGFILATVLLWCGKLSPDAWVLVFGAYAASNVAQKALVGGGGLGKPPGSGR